MALSHPAVRPMPCRRRPFHQRQVRRVKGGSVQRIPALLLAALCIGLQGGCWNDPSDLGRVSGTVFMDGQPLPKAQVRFQPGDGERPSVGQTRDDGTYTLVFNPQTLGAKLGSHTVAISTAIPLPDGGYARELVPPRYNTKSELTAEVEQGNNTIDFELESGGFGGRDITP